MKNKWRPDGWTKLLLRHAKEELGEPSAEKSWTWIMLTCMEIGADAMLEALKKKGERILRGTHGSHRVHSEEMETIWATGIDGWLVFIPEGDDDESTT